MDKSTSLKYFDFSRQEAVDMLSDLAARKLSSLSPCTSPRHLRQDPGASNFESLCSETGMYYL